MGFASRLADYLLGPRIDRDGREIPVSRLDMGRALAIAILLMFAIGCIAVDSRIHALLLFAGAVVLGLLPGNRRVSFIASFALVSVRFGFGLVFIGSNAPHAMLAIAATLLCTVMALVLVFLGD